MVLCSPITPLRYHLLGKLDRVDLRLPRKLERTNFGPVLRRNTEICVVRDRERFLWIVARDAISFQRCSGWKRFE